MISRSRRRALRADEGSAVVEFIFVGPLVLAIAVAVMQLVLALHVRSTLTAAAAEGARAGALAGSGTAMAERRTRDVLSEALGGSAATSVEADRSTLGGVPVMRVRITGRLPLLGLLGPTTMSVEGHALVEKVP